jgi:hypothetical protein
MISNLLSTYELAKTAVIGRGFEHEIRWQNSLSFDDLSESDFLKELAWVVMSSGMREVVVRRLFPCISKAFLDWESALLIVSREAQCRTRALRCFNNDRKIRAIIAGARIVNAIGFDNLKGEIRHAPIETLRKFQYIGPVTSLHLAKNIGLPMAKPDRHLVRIAALEGYEDVQDLCEDISRLTGDTVPVVDIVFWRFATIEPHYRNLFGDTHGQYDGFSGGNSV